MTRLNLGQFRNSGLLHSLNSGRAIGDVIYSKSAPTGSGYVLANGQTLTNTTYPKFVRKAKIFTFAPGEVALDTAGTSSTTTILVGSELWFHENSTVNLYKKATPTSEPSLVTTMPTANVSYVLRGLMNGVLVSSAFNSGNGATVLVYSSSPYTTWTSWGAGFASGQKITDVFWTGTAWLIGRNGTNGLLRTTTLGGTTTSATSISGVYTSLTTPQWGKFFKVGSVIYTQFWGTTAWGKSTDDGITWTSFTPTNGPVDGIKQSCFYSSRLGLFVGINISMQVVTATTPDGTWTSQATLAGTTGGTYAICEITDPWNAILITYSSGTGNGGYALLHDDMAVQQLTTSFSSGALAPQSAVEYSPGRVCFTFANSRNYDLKMPSTPGASFVVPNIAAVNGFTPYIRMVD